MNKIRKGEVKIYKGKEYIAIPEIEEESCTGCCFYDKGNTPARQGEIWTDERSTHDEEYFSIEDHNSAIVLPKGTIRRLTGRDLKWEDDPISLKSKSVIDKFPHADIEFYKQKIINFVEWI